MSRRRFHTDSEIVGNGTCFLGRPVCVCGRRAVVKLSWGIGWLCERCVVDVDVMLDEGDTADEIIAELSLVRFA